MEMKFLKRNEKLNIFHADGLISIISDCDKKTMLNAKNEEHHARKGDSFFIFRILRTAKGIIQHYYGLTDRSKNRCFLVRLESKY